MGYLENRDLTVNMPDISEWMLIGQYMSELGWAKMGMGGYSPIEFTEIEAWARVTGLQIQPWMANMIRNLSQQYANQANISIAPDCPPPYESELSDSDRATINKQVDAKIRELF